MTRSVPVTKPNTVAFGTIRDDFGRPAVLPARHRTALAEGIAAHLLPDAPRPGLASAGDDTLLEDLVHRAGRPALRGEGAGIDDPAAHDAHGVHEGQPVGILPGLLGGLVDQAARGVAGEHQPVDFLEDEIGRLAAQGGAGPEDAGLDLVMRGPDLPPRDTARRARLLPPRIVRRWPGRRHAWHRWRSSATPAARPLQGTLRAR